MVAGVSGEAVDDSSKKIGGEICCLLADAIGAEVGHIVSFIVFVLSSF